MIDQVSNPIAYSQVKTLRTAAKEAHVAAAKLEARANTPVGQKLVRQAKEISRQLEDLAPQLQAELS